MRISRGRPSPIPAGPSPTAHVVVACHLLVLLVAWLVPVRVQLRVLTLSGCLLLLLLQLLLVLQLQLLVLVLVLVPVIQIAEVTGMEVALADCGPQGRAGNPLHTTGCNSSTLSSHCR